MLMKRLQVVLFGRVPLLLVILIGVILVLSASPSSGLAQTVVGPSAFCHETDGAFTICPDLT